MKYVFFTFCLLIFIAFTAFVSAVPGLAATDPYVIPNYQTAFPCYFNYAADQLGFPANASCNLTSTTSTTNVPANTDSCSGTYSRELQTVPSHQNFGDPKCEFASNPAAAKDNLHKQLLQLDPAHGDTWFLMVAKESTYDPNAYLGNSTSGAGAYGLFQMNPGGKGVNAFDTGNVYWQTQASNAIAYLKSRYKTDGPKYTACSYWQSAKDITSQTKINACFNLPN